MMTPSPFPGHHHKCQISRVIAALAAVILLLDSSASASKHPPEFSPATCEAFQAKESDLRAMPSIKDAYHKSYTPGRIIFSGQTHFPPGVDAAKHLSEENASGGPVRVTHLQVCSSPAPFAYVKTHKTGSSTFAVTLFRLLHHYHTLPMVTGISNHIGFPKGVNPDLIQTDGRLSFYNDRRHVGGFLSHTSWTEETSQLAYRFLTKAQLLRLNDTSESTLELPEMSAAKAFVCATKRHHVFTFSILRNPYTRFLSSINFFGAVGPFKVLGINNGACSRAQVSQHVSEECILKLLDKLESSTGQDMMSGAQIANTVRYLMSYPLDLGMYDFYKDRDVMMSRDFLFKKTPEGEADMRRRLNELDERLDLMLITEQWPKSMAVLRHMLGVKVDDVLWWKTKVASGSASQEVRHKSVVEKYSDRVRERFEEVMWREYMVYEHFMLRFNAVVQHMEKEMGIDITEDAREIERRQEQIAAECDFLPFAKACKNRNVYHDEIDIKDLVLEVAQKKGRYTQNTR